MNCKNCAANYLSKELKCPYCGSANTKGETWLSRRQDERAEYERNLRKFGVTVNIITYDRIVGRIIKGFIGFLACYIVGIIVFFSLSETAAKISAERNLDKNIAQIDQLYKEERFGEMNDLLSESDLYGQDNYEYSQMALIYNCYEGFLITRLGFFEEMDTEITENSAETLVTNMHGVLALHFSAYPDMTSKNMVKLEGYQAEVADFAVNMLGFTEKELELLAEKDLMSDEQEALKTLLIEGRTSQ